jgi:hypothetical protein
VIPTREAILLGLATAANGGIPFAIGWHVVIAAALVALPLGWRPSRRAACMLLAAPLASASIAAWAVGNPFNGSIMALLAVFSLALASRCASERVALGSLAYTIVGGGMVAFAWFYPHFLVGAPLRYLYAAPIGLIPCPSFVIVVGFALLGGGFGNRAWSWTLAVASASYAVFGVVRLGVMLDVVLLIGALILAVRVSTGRSRLE